MRRSSEERHYQADGGDGTANNVVLTLAVDPPVVTQVVPAPTLIADTHAGANNFTLTITFDKDMNTGVNPTIIFPTAGENPSSTISFSSHSWPNNRTYVATYNVTDANVTLANIDVRITGAQGASGSTQTPADVANVFSIDMTAPIVAITRIGANPTNADQVTFNVIFSEPVNNVNAADFVLALSGVSANGTVVVGNAGDSDPATWTVTVTNITGEGTLSLDLAGATDIQDDAGNPVVQTPTTDETFTIDNTAPGVTLSPQSTITNDTTPSVTVTASDTGSGVPNGTTVTLDMDLNNDGDFLDANETGYSSGTLTGGTAAFDISPALSNGIYPLRGRVSDVAGNEGTSTIVSVEIDTQPPAITDVVDVTPDPRNSVVASIEVVFSEVIDLSTFTFADLTLTRNNSTITLDSTVQISLASETTYRITGLNGFTSADGDYSLTVNASGIFDGAGNTATGAGTDSWLMDTIAPDVTLSVQNPTNDNTPQVTVNASDTSSGFSNGTTVTVDVDLNNDGDFNDTNESGYLSGTLTNGMASFEISPALSDGIYQLRTRLSDLAGNEGTSSECH